MENTKDQLMAYIKACRLGNVSDLITRENLLHAGWNKEVVDRALGNNIEVPLPDTKDKGSRSMWDAFEHVILFISLYVFAISSGSVLFSLISIYFPITKYSSENMYMYDNLSGPLSAALVSFPLFAYLFIRIAKRTASVATIRSLPVRKFLIYATLVVAFIVALVNLSNLVYSFLSGEFTLNLLLKAIVVLSITGTIATYYLIQIREDATVR